MKNDKSKPHILKLNSNNDLLKKQISLQKEAAKKYQKFKKSASQPTYFLNKSRLDKISEIYRTASLQKLSKNYSLNKSKSLHNNLTPQKKPSFSNNNSFKKQSGGTSTLNINKAFDTNEKTRRLRLDKTIQHASNNHSVDISAQSATKFLSSQVERLEQISKMSTQKAFTAQWQYFFKSLKEQCFNRKGYNSQIKSIVSKFCYLLQQCLDRIGKNNENELKNKYNKMEMDYSYTNTELKKKSFKLELLIKEIDQLKLHNMKIASQLYQLKEEKRTSFGSDKFIKRNKRLQITNMIEIKINGNQSELNTPIYQYNFDDNSMQSSFNQFKPVDKNQPHVEKESSNKNEQSKAAVKFQLNQRLQMIKKIRGLEKKQKDLVKTLLVLKSDGIDVERAFNEVASGQVDEENLSQTINLQKQRVPTYIRKIKNQDSYDADVSIVESIEGLTVRYFEGEPPEEYVFYPIKHQYKSKPLDEELQNKLKLNFNVLYEDYDCPPQSSSSSSDTSFQEPPTI